MRKCPCANDANPKLAIFMKQLKKMVIFSKNFENQLKHKRKGENFFKFSGTIGCLPPGYAIGYKDVTFFYHPYT
jgi:hypothetical protein